MLHHSNRSEHTRKISLWSSKKYQLRETQSIAICWTDSISSRVDWVFSSVLRLKSSTSTQTSAALVRLWWT
jgi:hypothetical protein